MDTLTESEKIKKRMEEKQKKLDAIKLSIKQEKAKFNKAKRKERTKRLIEKGAIIEKFQGENAENISPEETLEQCKENEFIKRRLKRVTMRGRRLEEVFKLEWEQEQAKQDVPEGFVSADESR